LAKVLPADLLGPTVGEFSMQRYFPRLAFLIFSAVVGLAGFQSASLAQTVRPYQRIAVTLNVVTPEPALKALIEALRKSAAADDVKAIEAALAPDVQVIICKPDPLAPCAPGAPGVRSSDKSKPAPVRLRETLCCPGVPTEQITEDLRNETITGHISGALESGQTTGHDTPGLVCTPNWAIYDRNRARAIVTAAGVDPLFLRYASEPIEYRDKPDEKAKVAGRIPKGDLVPMLSDVATDMPDGWNAIALPEGKIAFTDAIGLEELTPSGTCFRKDAAGWKIALVMSIE
jgi:hypothetical protein